MEKHELMGFIALGIISFFAIVRLALRKSLKGGLMWLMIVLGLASAGVVAYGGYLGGEMVYTHGAGVGAAETAIKENAVLEGKLKAMERDDKKETEKLELDD